MCYYGAMIDKKNILAVLMLAVGALGGYLLITKDVVSLPDGNEPKVEDQAVEETREFISIFEGIDPAKIKLVSIEETEWPNGCLGLPQDSEMCTQALVPGYKIVLDADGRIMTFRTNKDGSSIRKEKDNQ